MSSEHFFSHPTSVVDKGSTIGRGTKIWHFAHVSAGAKIGEECVLGQNTFVADGVIMGNNVKVQNNVAIYTGTVIGDDVFLGPSCVLTNVTNPRSQVNRHVLFERTEILRGATVGANATIVCGVTLGRYCFIAAGAVVTTDVQDYALMQGVPAKQNGWMSRHGHRLKIGNDGQIRCPESGFRYHQTTSGQMRCLDLDEDKPLPDSMSKGSKSYDSFKASSTSKLARTLNLQTNCRNERLASNSPNHRNAGAWADTLALLTSICIGAALLCFVFYCCRFGFDFTDEGADLVSISNPWHYSVSITQFGFLYHPLFLIFKGDIFSLRVANAAITFSLAWLMWSISLKYNRKRVGSAFRSYGFVLSAASFGFLLPWLPTPDYDTLALQALIVAASGMILSADYQLATARVGWILIGLGGWLAFMAKPTTSIGLACVILLHMLTLRKLSFWMLGIALVVAGGFFVIGAWAIDHSIMRFVTRIILAVGDAKEAQSGHTIGNAMRIDSFHLGGAEVIILTIQAAVTFIATLLTFSTRTAFRVSGSLSVTAILIVAVFMSRSESFSYIHPTRFDGLQFWGAPSGFVVARLAASVGSFKQLPDPATVSRALCFAVLPLVYSFGSNVNYWLGACQASIFWILAAVTLLIESPSTSFRLASLLPISAISQLCAAALLLLSVNHPYRESLPLSAQDVPILIGNSSHRLFVTQDLSVYLANLLQSATKAGYIAGDPVVDLTGHYPGALFAIRATAVGAPWIIGGYKGSEALALTKLGRVAASEIAKAWVLTEPDGPRCIPLTVLRQFGRDIPKDYVEVGTFASPHGDYPTTYTQHLYKAPIH